MKGQFLSMLVAGSLALGTSAYAQEGVKEPASSTAPITSMTIDAVINHLAGLSREKLDGLFDIDNCKGYHARQKEGKLSLTEVFNSDIQKVRGYSKQIREGKYEHLDDAIKLIDEMKQGRTVVPWAGEVYRLSERDHRRPYERAVSSLESIKTERAAFDEEKKNAKRDIKMFMDKYDSATAQQRAHIEAQMETLCDKVGAPFICKDDKRVGEACDFLEKELERRNCSYPDAKEGELSVVFEPVTTAWKREKMREIASSGRKQPVIILQQMGREGYDVRVFQGDLVNVYRIDKGK